MGLRYSLVVQECCKVVDMNRGLRDNLALSGVLNPIWDRSIGNHPPFLTGRQRVKPHMLTG